MDVMNEIELGCAVESRPAFGVKRHGGYRYCVAGAAAAAFLLLVLPMFVSSHSKRNEVADDLRSARRLLWSDVTPEIPRPLPQSPDTFYDITSTQQHVGDYLFICGRYNKGDSLLPLCITLDIKNNVVKYFSAGRNQDGRHEVFKSEKVATGIDKDGKTLYSEVVSYIDPRCPAACADDGGVKVDGSDKCFYVPLQGTTPATATWQDAERTCSQTSAHSGTLAQIFTSNENNLAYELAKASGGIASHGGMWIGAHHSDAPGSYDEHSFTWTEGGWVNDYPQFWAPQEPNNFNGNENCAEMYYLECMWNDDDCSKEQPFICSRPERHDYCNLLDYFETVVS